MPEIIYGIDMNTSTSNYAPPKRYCKETGKMCELAGDFGYCRLTACIKYDFQNEKREADNG